MLKSLMDLIEVERTIEKCVLKIDVMDSLQLHFARHIIQKVRIVWQKHEISDQTKASKKIPFYMG